MSENTELLIKKFLGQQLETGYPGYIIRSDNEYMQSTQLCRDQAEPKQEAEYTAKSEAVSGDIRFAAEVAVGDIPGALLIHPFTTVIRAAVKHGVSHVPDQTVQFSIGSAQSNIDKTDNSAHNYVSRSKLLQ